MNHLGTVAIETERLLLRRFTLDDAQAAFRNWMSDPRVTEFLTWPPHASIAVTERVLRGWLESYEKPDCYQWAIALKPLGEPIGSISVVEQNERIASAQVGYCVGRAWWGQGVMTEAFAAVIAFLFERVGVNRVEARHDPDNPRSGAVMRKCGLLYEGTHRAADWSNRGVVDMAIYALLAGDYFARKGA